MLRKSINIALLIIFTFIYNVGAVSITSTYCEEMGKTNYLIKCCCCDHSDSHKSCCETKITVKQNDYESTFPHNISFKTDLTFTSIIYPVYLPTEKYISTNKLAPFPPDNLKRASFTTPIRI